MSILYVTGFGGPDPDLWLYDVQTDKVRRLTKDGAQCREGMPQFLSETVVRFTCETQEGSGKVILYEMDLTTGARRTVITLTDPHRWYFPSAQSPSTEEIVLVKSVSAKFEDSRMGIYLYAPSNNKMTLLRTLGNADAGEFSYADQTSVSWGPSDRILVVDTGLTGEETMFVLNRDGSLAAKPRHGTFAQWSSDGRSIYFQLLDEPFRWYALDIATDSVSPLPMTAGTLGPSLSPNGRILAHSGPIMLNGDTSSIYLSDLAVGGPERVLAKGWAYPIWLGKDRIAASQIVKCRKGNECGCKPWFCPNPPAVWELNLKGERVRQLSLPTTGWLVGSIEAAIFWQTEAGA